MSSLILKCFFFILCVPSITLGMRKGDGALHRSAKKSAANPSSLFQDYPGNLYGQDEKPLTKFLMQTERIGFIPPTFKALKKPPPLSSRQATSTILSQFNILDRNDFNRLKRQNTQINEKDVTWNKVISDIINELDELDNIMKVKRKRSKESSDDSMLYNSSTISNIFTSMTSAISNESSSSNSEVMTLPSQENERTFSKFTKAIASHIKLRPLLVGILLGINGTVLLCLLIWAIVYLFKDTDEISSEVSRSRRREFIRRDINPPSDWDILFHSSEEVMHPSLRAIVIRTPLQDSEPVSNNSSKRNIIANFHN